MAPSRILAVAAALLALLLGPARADWSATNASGGTFYLKGLNLPNNTQAPQHGLVDATGAPIATANPLPVAVVSGGGGGASGDLSTTNNMLLQIQSLMAASADVRLAPSPLSLGVLNNAIAVALDRGRGSVGWSVVGLTGTGATLTIEASVDGGATWAAVNGVQPGTGLLFTTLTTDQQFRVDSGGRTNVRVRVSTVGTGTATVAYSASLASSLVAISSPLPPGNATIGNVGIVGTPAVTLAGASTVSISGTPTVTANAGTGNFNSAAVGATGAAAPASATSIAGLNVADSTVRIPRMYAPGAGEYVLGANLRISQPTGGSIEAKGQQAMASSVPVAIASDQSAVPVSLAAVPTHPVTQSGAFTTTPVGRTSMNSSGTVATANTFQTVLAANTGRGGCLIQNPTTAIEVLYVNFGAVGSATTGNSFTLAAGAGISCSSGGIVLTDAVNVTAGTAGHAFVALQQ